MAKIKFGEVQARIESPKVLEKLSFDPMKIIQDVIDNLPKAEPIEIPKVDLSAIEEKISQLQSDLEKVNKDRERDNVNVCKCSEPSIIIPEVKTITHVKDVSEDVLKEVRSMIKNSEQLNNMALKNHIDSFNKIEKNHRLHIGLLTIGLIIITLLHLF